MDLSVSWVTEVPTPYRNYRYVRMAEIFPRHGIGFDVRYLAWTVPGRYWVFEDEDFGYPYRVFAGIHPRVLGIDMHANPSLLWRLLRKPTDVVVVGGYNSPTLALSPFCSRNSIRLLESESNPQSARWTAGPAGWIKRALLHRYDGYMGPGPRSFDLLCQLDPAAAAKPFIEFPNLIDERVFRDGVARARAQRAEIRRELGVSERDQLWICPARLEEFKGLHLFLPWLEGLHGVQLLVAGEGSLRSRLQAMIDSRSLPVRLLGQKREDEMVRLYAAADLFVLPSLRDPNPLSAIEACAASLPILASRRIGNFDQVLIEERSGWGFDPESPDRDLVQRVAALSRDELRRRAEFSAELYRDNFDGDRCISRVAEGIRDVHARHRRQR